MKKIFKLHQQGMSLVESMVGLGLMGGLVLAITQLSQQGEEIETKMGINQEVNALVTQVKSVLRKNANCTSTLKGKKPGDTLPGIYSIAVLPDIRATIAPETGDKVFTPGMELGNKRLTLTEMKLINKSMNGADLGDHIRLTLKPLNQPEITKDFLIRGEKDADGKYLSCQSMMGNEIEEGIAQICKSVEARWDEEKKKCFLENLPTCFLTDETACNTEGDSTEQKYVDKGNVVFTQYDYTVCETQYKRTQFPVKCRFPPAPDVADGRCKCQPYGCTCLADEKSCTGRWQKGCWLEYKKKELKKCCLPGVL